MIFSQRKPYLRNKNRGAPSAWVENPSQSTGNSHFYQKIIVISIEGLIGNCLNHLVSSAIDRLHLFSIMLSMGSSRSGISAFIVSFEEIQITSLHGI